MAERLHISPHEIGRMRWRHFSQLEDTIWRAQVAQLNNDD